MIRDHKRQLKVKHIGCSIMNDISPFKHHLFIVILIK